MKQSEIWLINLDPTTGAEIKKTRLAVVVNDDTLGRLPLKVIVPLTHLSAARQDGKMAIISHLGWSL